MSSAFRGIFFDLGNVLVMFDARRAARKFSNIFGITEQALWKELFESELERDYTRGKISSEDFFLGLNKNFRVQ